MTCPLCSQPVRVTTTASSHHHEPQPDGSIISYHLACAIREWAREKETKGI